MLSEGDSSDPFSGPRHGAHRPADNPKQMQIHVRKALHQRIARRSGHEFENSRADEQNIAPRRAARSRVGEAPG
jgi:hypothetical protein